MLSWSVYATRAQLLPANAKKVGYSPIKNLLHIRWRST